MDTTSICNAVERACREFSIPATRADAERVLTEFRNLKSPYEACKHILETSNDPEAEFQALLAYREAAIREWPTLPDGMRGELLRFALHGCIVKHAGDPRPLIRLQAAGCAAALLKRSWTEMAESDRHVVMNSIDALSTQVGTAQARQASMEVLCAVVTEFNPSSASAMGLPWDIHERCRHDLQEGYLLGFLQHAIVTCEECAPAAMSDSGVASTLATSLNLISTVLAWDFKPSGNGAWRVMDDQRPADVGLLCRPPASWREVLLNEGIKQWLAPLSAACRTAEAAHSSLATAVRQIVVQLCAVTGDIFEADQARKELGLNAHPLYSKTEHLSKMLSIVLSSIVPPAIALELAAHGSECILLDACRALIGAASVHRLSGFLAAGEGLHLPPGTSVVDILADLTVAVLETDKTHDWASEAIEMLLDVWAELIIDPCRGAALGPSESAIRAVARVFGAAMHRELIKAATSVYEDEAEYDGGEEAQLEAWLAGIATVGRAAAGLVLPELARSLKSCKGELEACILSHKDPSAVLEQLCWLLHMSGHVLADAGDGEMPLVPVAVSDACNEAAKAGTADPALELAHALLEMGSFCTEHAGKPAMSPRLMEEVCSTLGRWADTYLLLPNGHTLSAALNANFSPSSHGPAIADGLVNLATAALTRYPGERNLHNIACTRLLTVLVQRDLAASIVVQSASWSAICQAVANNVEGIRSLEAGVQRKLLQCLCLAASGCQAQEDTTTYIHSLLQPLVSEVVGMASLGQAVLHRADASMRTLCLLQALRGSIRGGRHGVQSIIYTDLVPGLGPLLVLFTIYKGHPAIYAAILKMAADVVEYHGDFLAPGEGQTLLAWCGELLSAYSTHNRGVVDVVSSGNLQSERQEEQYKSLRAMLRLLNQLTNLDNAADGHVSRVVVCGMDVLIPLVSTEHLKFPKLRRAFFVLLAHIFEVYSGQVAALPRPSFVSLHSALCFGMGIREDQEAEAAVFEAAAALAKHHLLAVRAGAQGLGANNAPDVGGQTPLSALLQILLQRVLIDDNSSEAIDYAAEAALPLILSEQHFFQQSAATLGLESVMPVFAELAAVAGACSTLDRPSRRKFQTSFRQFVVDVRAALFRK